MDHVILGLALAALGAGLALLSLRLRRSARQRADTRAAFLDRCKPLFSDLRVATEPTGFPRISGRHRGAVFDLRTMPDSLTFRKLPALWVLVTLPGPISVGATLDLMIRPMGIEPFSHFNGLPDQLTPPPGFPADCAIRSDDPGAAPSQELVRRHLHLFDDPRMKELVISPHGLRLVLLADEAQRGAYLIFRDAELGATPLAPDRLRPVLDALLALRDDIQSGLPDIRRSRIA